MRQQDGGISASLLASLCAGKPLCIARARQAEKPPARQPQQHPHPTEVSAPQAAAVPPQHLPRSVSALGTIPDLLHLAAFIPPLAKGEAALDPVCLQVGGTCSHHAHSPWSRSHGGVSTPSTHHRPLSRLPGCSKEARVGRRGGAFSPTLCFEVCTPASCKVPYLESSRSPKRLPGGPCPQQVKKPSWKANSPRAWQDSSAVLEGLPTRERGAGSDEAEPATKIP